MRNWCLIVSYDGTDFYGWQRQPGRRTVQAVLEQAIAAITGESQVRLNVSGRTDAGVHALGQVANFFSRTRLDPPTLGRAINSQLPDDVVVRGVAEVPQSFDANKDARWKCYRYVIQQGPWPDPFWRRYAWYCRGPLNVAAMQQAAALLVGRRDCRALETAGSKRLSTIRVIRHAAVEQHGKHLWIEVEADGFLYNMMRAIAGSLVEVGRGRWSVADFAAMLRCGDRRQAGPNAPPHGLFLRYVVYDPPFCIPASCPAAHADADATGNNRLFAGVFPHL